MEYKDIREIAVEFLRGKAKRVVIYKISVDFHRVSADLGEWQVKGKWGASGFSERDFKMVFDENGKMLKSDLNSDWIDERALK